MRNRTPVWKRYWFIIYICIMVALFGDDLLKILGVPDDSAVNAAVVISVLLFLALNLLKWLFTEEESGSADRQVETEDELPSIEVPNRGERDRRHEYRPREGDNVSVDEELVGPPLELDKLGLIIATRTGDRLHPALSLGDRVQPSTVQWIQPYVEFWVNSQELVGRKLVLNFGLMSPTRRTRCDWERRIEVILVADLNRVIASDVYPISNDTREGEWTVVLNVISHEGQSRSWTTTTIVVREQVEIELGPDAAVSRRMRQEIADNLPERIEDPSDLFSG